MLDKKLHYLQIAFNSTLDDARNIIADLPLDRRIILEAGTPLIKKYGDKAIRSIAEYWESRFLIKSISTKEFLRNQSLIEFALSRPIGKKADVRPFISPYIVADMKCQDRGEMEVEIAKEAGASAITVNGNAPAETINSFILKCKNVGIDSMIDMMNVEQPVKILKKLKNLPTVVVLHRGVDEEQFNRDKPVPYQQITKIRSSYDILISVAGGDTIREVQRAIFNDADIVVVWKEFYSIGKQTSELAKNFLKVIK